ncbi:MAG TPA: hypothetical protein VF186_05915 [Gaiellaceae bacterium]|jgi:hypothetical protein
MSRKRVKQYLMLLTVIGLIAVAANGAGTFASFSAQTTNAGNTFASGTLFLHNKVGTSGTTCTSEVDSNNGTTDGTTCDTLFTVSDVSSAQTAKLTLTNAGSLDSAHIDFKATSCQDSIQSIGTVGGSGVAASAIDPTITIANLNQPLADGTKIEAKDSTGTYQTFTVSTTSTFAAGSSVDVTTTGTNGSNTIPAGNDVAVVESFATTQNLCSTLPISVQETDSSFAAISGICAWPSDASNDCSASSTTKYLSDLPTSFTDTTNQTQLNLKSGGGSGNTGTALSAGGSRYFLITVDGSSLGNTAQNAQASFDVSWQISH